MTKAQTGLTRCLLRNQKPRRLIKAHIGYQALFRQEVQYDVRPSEIRRHSDGALHAIEMVYCRKRRGLWTTRWRPGECPDSCYPGLLECIVLPVLSLSFPLHCRNTYPRIGIALFRALLQQCKSASLGDEHRCQVRNIIRNKFKANEHVHSKRRLTVAFHAGYEVRSYSVQSNITRVLTTNPGTTPARQVGNRT